MATTPTYVVVCDSCGQRHPAEPAHLDQWSNRQLYAVVCTQDQLTDYYTAERLVCA